jgi:hypothetical protein
MSESVSDSIKKPFVMNGFLCEFLPTGTFMQQQQQCIPCAFDCPTKALVQFEMLLMQHDILQSSLRNALDQLSLDYFSSTIDSLPRIEPREVFKSIMREICDAIIKETNIQSTLIHVLQAFVEQMVFSRLGNICYVPYVNDLNECNLHFQKQLLKTKCFDIYQIGLPKEILQVVLKFPVDYQNSIETFSKIPHLIPSSVLAGFLLAVRTLYEETRHFFDIQCNSSISADILLPLLVYVLSRARVPFLYTQVFLMENYAIDPSKEGSEAAYYLACLQAAMGYIMSVE